MVNTTMALLWTVNYTLSWSVKFQNSIFLPLQMPPPCTVPPTADAARIGCPPFASPFPPLLVFSVSEYDGIDI